MDRELPFDKEEYERWLSQAKYTLESAEEDLKHGKFSWSCFKSQQAAEYAVKGLLHGVGKIPIGHSLTRLVRRMSRWIDLNEALKHARTLDRHYIPTRYPNAHPEGAPYEYYDEDTAQEALKSSRKLLEMVEKVASKWLK